MEQYLIDTNVVSDYFSLSLSKNAILFLDSVFDNIPNLSVITQIELLSWKTDINIEKQIESFISDSVVNNITPSVISYCINIRRNRKIKTPDAIIAATALSLGYTLITKNEKDFANIKGLKIVNPSKL